MENAEITIIKHKSKLFVFTIICNVGLFVFIVSEWANERRVSEEELFVFSSLTILVVLNIYVLLKSNNKNMENFPGLIGLYLKRRRLEEELKIKELEKESNKQVKIVR